MLIMLRISGAETSTNGAPPTQEIEANCDIRSLEKRVNSKYTSKDICYLTVFSQSEKSILSYIF